MLQGEDLKSTRKSENMTNYIQNSTLILMAEISKATVETRRQWISISFVLKKKSVNPNKQTKNRLLNTENKHGCQRKGGLQDW